MMDAKKDIDEPDLPASETRRMMRNVLAISIAFTFLFTAFQSMAALQSSLNPDAGLGTYSLSTIYGAIVLSCAFLPTYLIKRFTVKYTLMFCMLCYSVYIAAQFYPTFGTLIPGAVVLGLAAAPMWSAKCTYLTQVGYKYAQLSGEGSEPVIVRFFGIFFLLFQSSAIWGNIISTQVLAPDDDNYTIPSDEDLKLCGINFCPSAEENSNNTNLEGPEKSKIYTLAGIYLGAALTSVVLVFFFVDPLTRYGEKSREQSGLTGVRLLAATFLHLVRSPNQILIIPLTMWSGVEQGFFGSEFTRAFVSCAWGTHNIGYVLICYGVVDALCSLGFGYLIKLVGRIPIFVLGALINAGVIIVLFTWAPNPDNVVVFFVLAGGWGMADAVWQTQINALYGVLFPDNEEAAFSNYRLWESVGFIIAYVLNNVACVYAHTWVVVGFLAVGMGGYFVVEFKERFSSKTFKLED